MPYSALKPVTTGITVKHDAAITVKQDTVRLLLQNIMHDT